MELEDDLFFADLSKQISLLIMDEDEDPHTSCRPHSIQVFSLACFLIHHTITHLMQLHNLYWQIEFRRHFLTLLNRVQNTKLKTYIFKIY
jgi:hypothetical protein